MKTSTLFWNLEERSACLQYHCIIQHISISHVFLPSLKRFVYKRCLQTRRCRILYILWYVCMLEMGQCIEIIIVKYCRFRFRGVIQSSSTLSVCLYFLASKLDPQGWVSSWTSPLNPRPCHAGSPQGKATQGKHKINNMVSLEICGWTERCWAYNEYDDSDVLPEVSGLHIHIF